MKNWKPIRIGNLEIAQAGSVPRYGIEVFLSFGKHYVYFMVYLPDFGLGKVE